MKKQKLFTLLTCLSLTAGGFAADAQGSVGVVNFVSCVTESKVGKQEQASFESLKKQMLNLLEDTEKQLTDINTKLNDKEYLDGLSPEAEDEMKGKFRHLNEELGRYQNQYYQVLNQANMKLIQVMSTNINNASERVAKEKHLGMIVNKDACFFYAPQLDVTNLVVAEMDKTFAAEQKNIQAALPAAEAATPVKADAKTETPAKTTAAPVEEKKDAPAKTAAADKKDVSKQTAAAPVAEKTEVKAKKEEAKKK